MKDEYLEKGAEILGPESNIDSVVFIVEGVVDLIVFDKEGQENVLDSLTQGDIVG